MVRSHCLEEKATLKTLHVEMKAVGGRKKLLSAQLEVAPAANWSILSAAPSSYPRFPADSVIIALVRDQDGSQSQVRCAIAVAWKLRLPQLTPRLPGTHALWGTSWVGTGTPPVRKRLGGDFSRTAGKWTWCWSLGLILACSASNPMGEGWATETKRLALPSLLRADGVVLSVMVRHSLNLASGDRPPFQVRNAPCDPSISQVLSRRHHRSIDGPDSPEDSQRVEVGKSLPSPSKYSCHCRGRQPEYRYPN